jgi:hypothetical protein
MKKFLSFLAVATFVVALSSCGSKTEAPAEAAGDSTQTEVAAPVDTTTPPVAADTTAPAADSTATH